LAEAVSAEPLAHLAPAVSSARAELEAMAANNRLPFRRHQVGFARNLAEPLRLEVEPSRLAASVGARVGGGFLSRERSGDWVWGTSVAIENGVAMRLELAEVNLPIGTRFWVYPAGGGEARTFDLRLLRGDRSIVSPVIDGDRIHLEVQLPDGRLAPGQGFVIRRVHELFRSRNSLVAFAPEANACLQNAECYDNGDFPAIENARDGVIQYFGVSGGLNFVCSGGLLNDNVPATLVPWLLTANHCVETQAEAQTVDAVFHYRYNFCGSSNATLVGGPLGTDLVVTSAASDVTLLRASDPSDIPGGVFYLGWTSARPGDATVLHRLSHPVFDNPPPQLDDVLPQSYSAHLLDETPAIQCFGEAPLSHFLYSFNQGGTGISGGSSGSPLISASGQVVGQLFGTCGEPPSQDGCGTDESVVDGAFAASYPMLAPYLSPAGSVCVRDADTACLLNGEFKVEVTWQTATGSGQAQVMYFNAERAENIESAFFWFFNPTNFEMGVKMVNACVPPYNRFWAFVSGLTSQGYTVVITKMSSGAIQTYSNAVDEIPTTDADTDAFLCP
jgi:hypothetical protein